MEDQKKYAHTIEISRPTGPRVLPPLAGESRGYLAKYVPYHTIDRVKSGAVAAASVLSKPKVIAVGSSLALAVFVHIAISSLTHGFSSITSQASILLTGAGAVQTSAPGAYTGPGDVKAGWSTYWGMRAFNSVTRGNKLINACDSTGGTDVACADMLSDASTGAIVPKVIGGITCPNANCTIKTFYDISGATNCSGSVACDLTQATIANRATLTASAIATNTCAVGAGSAIYSNAAPYAGLSQPFSFSAVVKFSSTTGSPNYLGTSGSGGVGAGVLFATNFGFYAASNVTGAASDTSAHAIQSVANSASSFVVVDTSTGSTQNSGAGTITGGLRLFSDTFGNFYSGALCEAGIYPAAFNGTDATNMYNNQHTYWGF